VFNGVPNPPAPQPGTGSFTATGTNLGMVGGLVLSTGDVLDIPQAANQFASTDNLSLGGDPDLNALSNQAIDDHTIIEFDFIPTGDSLRFNYIFASEEYPTFVCTIFNDVFGFFLSGPGINGPFSNNAINIALVPGTALPVSISNINNGNPNDPNCIPSNTQFYTNNGNGADVVFNAFTTVLTAEAEVQCGETYHIKLAIGDAVDSFYDSAVFLEAGSFQSNQVAIASEVVSGGIDSLFYEGCGEATLTLVRGGPLADADTVEILVAGSATPGIDYTQPPPWAIFQPGQDSVIVTISAILDQISEGQENILLMAINEGACGSDTVLVEILIEEAPWIDIVLSNDTTLTCNDSALVTATVTGGFGNYTLDWDQGIPDGAYSGWVSPSQTTSYTLTVGDDCGVITVQGSVTISIPVPAPLEVQIVPDAIVPCPETPVLLQANVQGGTPAYTFQWGQGLGASSTATVAPPVTTSYSVTVTDRCGEDTMDVVTVTVAYDTLRVRIERDTIICIGDTATLVARPSQGYGSISYQWSTGGVLDTVFVAPVTNAIYGLLATDACGISAEDEAGVGVNAPMASFTWTGSNTEANFPIPFLDLSLGAQAWSWDFGVPGLTSAEQYPYPIFPDPGEFEVMLAIMDDIGCVDTTYRAIEIDPEFGLFVPNAFTPNGDGVNEVFRPTASGVLEYSLRIFDRWGEVLFFTEDLATGWDGTYQGLLVASGVYVYQIRMKGVSLQAFERMGHVSVLP
ncbi:MAG: choice-of-anchor L domain-containing protein, partial [Flavobacteriales bacterium]|nr:choice-of-anchor L domain-containing protein [Flavobacteriales bacterium]